MKRGWLIITLLVVFMVFVSLSFGSQFVEREQNCGYLVHRNGHGDIFVKGNPLVAIKKLTSIGLKPLELTDLDELNKNYTYLMIQEGFMIGIGSGFVINNNGEKRIITCFHVVNKACGIKDGVDVKFFDGREVRATVEKIDPLHDLAILVANDIPTEIPGISVESFANTVKFGEIVYKIGSSRGFFDIPGIGVVGAYKPIDYADTPKINMLVVDMADTYPGNSGAPVFNRFGQVLGVFFIVYTDERGAPLCIGGAIPFNVIKDSLNFMSSKKQDGKIDLVGVAMDVGLLVVKSDYNSLRAADLIRRVEGEKITEPELFKAIVNSFDKGDQLSIELIRDGVTMTLKLTVK